LVWKEEQKRIVEQLLEQGTIQRDMILDANISANVANVINTFSNAELWAIRTALLPHKNDPKVVEYYNTKKII
jgi:hypothetical protein